jgi:hypothetical protein
VNEGGSEPPAQGDAAPPDPAAVDAAMKECSKIFDQYPELDDVQLPGRSTTQGG